MADAVAVPVTADLERAYGMPPLSLSSTAVDGSQDADQDIERCRVRTSRRRTVADDEARSTIACAEPVHSEFAQGDVMAGCLLEYRVHVLRIRQPDHGVQSGGHALDCDMP